MRMDIGCTTELLVQCQISSYIEALMPRGWHFLAAVINVTELITATAFEL